MLGGAKGDLDKDNVEEKVVVFNTGRKTDFGSERTCRSGLATWSRCRPAASSAARM